MTPGHRGSHSRDLARWERACGCSPAPKWLPCAIRHRCSIRLDATPDLQDASSDGPTCRQPPLTLTLFSRPHTDMSRNRTLPAGHGRKKPAQHLQRIEWDSPCASSTTTSNTRVCRPHCASWMRLKCDVEVSASEPTTCKICESRYGPLYSAGCGHDC